MSTIILSDPSMSLASNSSSFTLRCGGKQVGKIPRMQLTRLIVHHGVSISTKALEVLTTLGTPVFFLDREANIAARLTSMSNNDPRLVLHLARAFDKPKLRLHIAQSLVKAKVANSYQVIQSYRSNYVHSDLKHISQKLLKILGIIDTSISIEQLRGFEGIAARYYYSAFPHLIRGDDFTFPGRNKRPPKDPVNTALSYIYTIISKELQILLEATGIDSSVSFLHDPEKRRASLALDLVEPFRAPLADRLTLKLFNLKILRPEHFNPPCTISGGIYLSSSGKKLIFEKMERWYRHLDSDTEFHGGLAPMRLLQNEVDSFYSHLKSDTLDDYSPYLICA